MTIAGCYVTSEGVVLGADSTATVPAASPQHYDYAQKLFQVGDRGGTLGFLCWGLNGLRTTSFRTLSAQLSDDLIGHPPANVAEVITRWCAAFWTNYLVEFAAERARCGALAAKAARTPQEEREFVTLARVLSGGHCIGGHVRASRVPVAFAFEYSPLAVTEPPVYEIPRGLPRWWACYNLVNRLIYGIDERVAQEIFCSGHWDGSPNDLGNLVNRHALHLPCELPLREAIDWVYSSIFVTIKAMKFSSLDPVCGGPIEIAVITSDREFRWVCHKGLQEAISLPAIAKGAV